MEKSKFFKNFIIDFSFVFAETLLTVFINVLLFICMAINGGTEGTFREWFQNRIPIVLLLPCAIALYGIIMYLVIKNNKINGISFSINAVLNAIVCIPVLSFCLPGPFSPGAFVPFDERTLLNRFREIICIVSFLMLFILNIVSAVLEIRVRDDV